MQPKTESPVPEPVIIKFYSPVTGASIGSLMKTLDEKIATGVSEFTLLISTSGGSVFYGLTAYNYLKGMPATVTMHNIGSVDSIGIALYCAGQQRPDDALEWGLVHEIRQQLFPEGAEVIPVQAGG